MAEDSTVHEPLIADEIDIDTTSRNLQLTSRAESAAEQHGTPTAFIWALTVAAGISGLLFGYEFVPASVSSCKIAVLTLEQYRSHILYSRLNWLRSFSKATDNTRQESNHLKHQSVRAHRQSSHRSSGR